MGQKVNPIGFRLGINRTWDSRWFARKDDYARLLHDDIKMRKMLKERLNQAGVSRIIIERPHKQCRVTIYAARPGVIIGKKGADIDKLRKDLAAMTEGEVALNIVEIRKPETDAQLVAENIAQQLERRVAFRRAMKRSMQSTMRLGAKGTRVQVSGRLGGAEIARMERYHEGRVPLHTLRADIDYGFREARTTYGRIGVKVWIYKGDILPYKISAEEKISREAAMATGGTAGGDRPRRVISAGGGRRRPEQGEPGEVLEVPEVPEGAVTTAEEGEGAPSPALIKEVDPELERLIAEEEEMERRLRGGHEAPHFRKEVD